jgi:hypothetical protein
MTGFYIDPYRIGAPCTWIMNSAASSRHSQVKAVDVEAWLKSLPIAREQGKDSQPDERLVFACHSVGVSQRKIRSRASAERRT